MIARDKPGAAEERTTHRPIHLEHLRSLGDSLLLAGALMGADGNPEGSLVVVEAESLETATERFMADPFVHHGVFATIEVKPWRLAINHTGREF